MTRYWRYKDGTPERFGDDYEPRGVDADKWAEVRVVPLDSVVIDGPLPEVTRNDNGWYKAVAVAMSPAVAAKARERAREYAAIAAAYERDHAIDEAQMKALAEDLAFEWGLAISESEVLAIHLVARGWTKVEK